MATVKDQTPVSATESAAPAVAVPAKKKSNKALWIIIGAVVFLFVVVPAIIFTAGALWLKNNASDKLAENAVEGIVERASGGQVDVNSQDGSFSVESQDGDSSFALGGDQKLPADFPKNDIPYLKEKTVSFVFTSTNEDKKSWSVTTTVNESFNTAKAFFADKIKSPDYTEVASYGFGESQTYYGVKAPYSVSVTVSESSDVENKDVNVSYMITQQ